MIQRLWPGDSFEPGWQPAEFHREFSDGFYTPHEYGPS